MSRPVNRQWLLARRPEGLVSVDDFRLDTSPTPEPGEGEVLVRNLFLSCDPTQRGWMAGDTYLPAVKIGEVMRAFAVGEVAASRNPAFAVGDRVFHQKFGYGEVLAADDNKLDVEFDHAGSKKVVARWVIPADQVDDVPF